jgi:hypothetical protein
VLRGGGWSSDTASCEVAYRDFGSSGSWDDYIGFRVARGRSDGSVGGSGGGSGGSVPSATTKEITSFSITAPVTAAGAISGTTITVSVPYGTNVTSMTTAITHTGSSISPAAWTVMDFNNPYT